MQAFLVECAAQGQAHFSVAEPAELEHGGLAGGEVECATQPSFGAARMHDEISLAARGFGLGEPNPEGVGDSCACGLNIQQLDLDPHVSAEEKSAQAAENASANDRSATAQAWRRGPDCVDGGL